MTAEQAIKKDILYKAIENEDYSLVECFDKHNQPVSLNEDTIDYLWEDFKAQNNHWDYISEYRNGTEKTNISPEYSRNYSSESVATQTKDGIWIGWTYWYGGGKHGDPEALDWMNSAYFLKLNGEKIIVTKIFEKA